VTLAQTIRQGPVRNHCEFAIRDVRSNAYVIALIDCRCHSFYLLSKSRTHDDVRQTVPSQPRDLRRLQEREMTFVNGKAAASDKTANQLLTSHAMREQHMAPACLRSRLPACEQHHEGDGQKQNPANLACGDM
jgi:hypothetical protein